MLKPKIKFIVSLAVLLAAVCGTAYGQNNMFGGGNQEIQYDEYGNPILPDETPEQQDTTKKARPRKPLESYFFDDSVRSRANFAWNPSLSMNRVNIYSIDTLNYDFQTDYPFLKKDVGDAYLGNLGGPSIPLNYFRRPQFRDFSFAAPYYSYIYVPETAPYYNVKKPFTQLTYATAGQRKYAEEIFALIHAQNITPATGFNITYQTNKTKGIYANQATNNTNLSAGIHHTGKKYTAHGGYIYNGMDNFESGGVVDDWHITGTRYETLFTIPMNLGDDNYYSTSSGNRDKARSIVKGHTFYTVHSYGIPLRRLTEDDFSMADVPAVYVGYALEYNRWHRKYTDSYVGSTLNYGRVIGDEPDPHYPAQPYYENWFLDGQYTRDSLFESKLSNRVFIQLQPWDRDGVVGVVDAGIGMDNHQFYMFRLDDYVTGIDKSRRKETSYYVYGAVEGKFRKYFDWGAQVRYVPTGYRAQDLDLKANAQLNVFVKDKPISLRGDFSLSLADPSYWTQNYYSNHFMWSNNFRKEKETRIDVTLSVPHINMEIGVRQSVMTDKIYYKPYYRKDEDGFDLPYYSGGDSYPVQHSGTVSLTGVYAHKDFRIGGFNFNHRVMMQWSTNQKVVPVPLVSAYISYFFEFNVVKDVLRMKIGLDGRYNTPYYAFGYNPAIGQFYNQREKEVGGYPMIDAFVSAKWKRMRIRFKVTHLHENWFDRRDYFSVLHYPLNKRMFKIGISWGFYD